MRLLYFPDGLLLGIGVLEHLLAGIGFPVLVGALCNDRLFHASVCDFQCNFADFAVLCDVDNFAHFYAKRLLFSDGRQLFEKVLLYFLQKEVLGDDDDFSVEQGVHAHLY